MGNMGNLEQVERLRAYADISIEEARDVLNEARGDLLEAVILLERRGKIKPPPAAGPIPKEERGEKTEYLGKQEEKERRRRERREYYDEGYSGETFSQVMGRFFRWVGRVIRRGNINTFKVARRGEDFINIPVTILVIFALFFFWWLIPLLIVGLFFDFRYSFEGPDLGRDNINRAADTAAEAAQKIKRDFRGDWENKD